MRGSKKYCQRGSNFDVFFLVDEGREDKRAFIGTPPKRHLIGASLAGRVWPNIEYWLGSFVIFRGSRQVLLKKPMVFFCNLSGGCPKIV